MDMEQKRRVRLEDVRLGQIRLRKNYDTAHVERLAADIKERGLLHPLVINSDGELVDGVYRYMALRHLGVKELDYDPEKRHATLPRESDYSVPEDSMAANVLRIGATDLEKAEYLKREIERRILDAPQGIMNALQFVTHVGNVEQYDRSPKYSANQRAELQKILNSLTLDDPGKTSLRTARRLLSMLDWPEDVREEFGRGELPQKRAEALSRLEKREEREELRRAIQEKDWTQRETEKAVEALRLAKEKGVERSVKEAILKHDAEPRRVAEVVKRLQEPDLIEEALQRTIRTEEEAEDIFEDNLEIAEDIEAGRLMGEGIEIQVDPDIKRLQRFEELRDRITGLRGFDFDMIEDAELKQQAVDCIRQIRDFCEALLAQLAERR